MQPILGSIFLYTITVLNASLNYELSQKCMAQLSVNMTIKKYYFLVLYQFHPHKSACMYPSHVSCLIDALTFFFV